MIRINLLGEKKDNSVSHILQLALYCLSVLLLLGACFALKSSATATLEELENKRAGLEANLVKLKKKTKKVDELEEKKTFLSEKLTTIANLKAKRQGPVQVLDTITEVIPERAWIETISQTSSEMELKGLAVDPQTVSEFMRELESSRFFTSVDLDYSRQLIRDSVKLQSFSVVARLADALKLQAEMNKEADGKASGGAA